MGRKKPILLIFCCRFSRLGAPIQWLVHGLANNMTSNRKQFTVTREKLAKYWPLLHLIRACSWRWPDVVAGISARFDPFVLQNNKSSNLKNCETKFTVPLGTSHEVLIEIIDFFAILFETYHCGNFEFSLWIYFNLQFMATKNDSTASKRRYQVGLMTPPYG